MVGIDTSVANQPVDGGFRQGLGHLVERCEIHPIQGKNCDAGELGGELG